MSQKDTWQGIGSRDEDGISRPGSFPAERSAAGNDPGRGAVDDPGGPDPSPLPGEWPETDEPWDDDSGADVDDHTAGTDLDDEGEDEGEDSPASSPAPPPRGGAGLTARKPGSPFRAHPGRSGGGGGSDSAVGSGSRGGGRRGRKLVAPEDAAVATRSLTPQQKLLILDAWQRSALPAKDFAPIAGVSRQALYGWKRRFAEHGPSGLVDGAALREATGTRLPMATRRAIMMLKRAHPEWGCQRISDVLYREPGLAASEGAVARVLKDEGYVMHESPTRPHRDHVRSFERAAPNQLWQTDLFTFVLKRQNRRVYLVAFMDDHSRYIVGYGLHASQNAALVLEVFRASIASCGVPQEVLTDNGAQYVTWRGTSRFAAELAKRGVKHIVSTPRRPQALGKIERFWGTLWRECIETSIFLDLEDARRRLGHFIDHYNFQRPHQGIAESSGTKGLTPADRFFGAAKPTLAAMKARVADNALVLAREGVPRAPFYITGRVGEKPFSVHAEGERMVMIDGDGGRREVDLVAPPAPPASPTPPAPAAPPTSGESPLPIEVARAIEQVESSRTGAASMPEPLCAAGVVTRELDDEGELPPGMSALDESTEALREGGVS